MIMDNKQDSQDNLKILSSLASIFGLLGIAFYFCGWIYRWSYFSFFNLDLNVIASSFTPQSFLFLPIQVFFGDLLSAEIIPLLRVAFALFCLLIICYTSWNFLSFLDERCLVGKRIRNASSKRFYSNTFWSGFKVLVPDFFGFLLVIITSRLFRFLLIIALTLGLLFWVSRIQGLADARRDFFSQKTKLPAIALIKSGERLPLGRNIDRIEDKEFSGDYYVIGSTFWYEYLRNKDVNSSVGTSNEQVWRLLLETDRQLYIFITEPNKPSRNARPLVVSIPKQNDGIYILSISPA
jgi:hypothetical protein